MKYEKNFLWIVILIAAVVLIGIRGLFAYYNASDSVNNVFTAGEIKAELIEPSAPVVDKDGNGIIDNWERLVPCQVITKDPMVANTGTNDAFIFVSVEIPKETFKAVHEDGSLGEQKTAPVYTFSLEKGWEEVFRREDESVVTCMYAYAQNGNCTILAAGETTNQVFSTVATVNFLEGTIVSGTKAEIPVKAYAIQASSLGIDGDTTDTWEVFNLVAGQFNIDLNEGD